eukprot:1473691-Prymnesium_polylepis.1
MGECRRRFESPGRGSGLLSDATVMAKPVLRLSCSPALLRSDGARPMSTSRRNRSLVSVTRFHLVSVGEGRSAGLR